MSTLKSLEYLMGMHAIDNDKPIKPTKYTVKAITYAVLDLLLWFGKTVNRNVCK